MISAWLRWFCISRRYLLVSKIFAASGSAVDMDEGTSPRLSERKELCGRRLWAVNQQASSSPVFYEHISCSCEGVLPSSELDIDLWCFNDNITVQEQRKWMSEGPLWSVCRGCVILMMNNDILDHRGVSRLLISLLIFV